MQILTAQKILNLLPVIIATGGLFLALYIFTKKKRKEILVCPLDSDCDAVVHSRYSTFLGIPLEVMGIFYFAFIALFFLSAFFIPQLNSSYFLLFAPAVTLGAFLFSIYLVLVQLLVIKQWCAWCLISTILCTMEFALVLTLSPLNIKGLFAAIFNI